MARKCLIEKSKKNLNTRRGSITDASYVAVAELIIENFKFVGFALDSLLQRVRFRSESKLVEI